VKRRGTRGGRHRSVATCSPRTAGASRSAPADGLPRPADAAQLLRRQSDRNLHLAAPYARHLREPFTHCCVVK
jgi:hypothetical protein